MVCQGRQFHGERVAQSDRALYFPVQEHETFRHFFSSASLH